MPSKKIDLTVTLEPGSDAAAIAKRLAAAGLEVTDVLDAVSVVHGRAPKSAQARLAKVAGVTDVTSTLSVDIGPGDQDPS
ncbi:hypothetical protein [Variovorax sp. J22R115]|uniref:hypothetical protein n=1 Tax=Variovorax sp. J22R115 TaxID=3053509 RepID=UPI0025771188|nr:hypothetical protein [Variovorax sp. J22R115]MDM0053036.1 hypothetical protein [Variovorax sp. J22R115]